MQIHASTKSRAWKRGAENKIAELLKIPSPPGLHSMVGSLHLDAQIPADIALLTTMYNHVFSRREAGGSIVVYDDKHKKVLTYYYAKKHEPKPRRIRQRPADQAASPLV